MRHRSPGPARADIRANTTEYCDGNRHINARRGS